MDIVKIFYTKIRNKIKIKLINPLCCDGCPLLSYIATKASIEGVAFCKYKNRFITLKLNNERVIRPKQCIKECGR